MKSFIFLKYYSITIIQGLIQGGVFMLTVPSAHNQVQEVDFNPFFLYILRCVNHK